MWCWDAGVGVGMACWYAMAGIVVAIACCCYHWRGHAVGSQLPDPAVARLPGTLPLLGDAIPVLRHLPDIHDWLLLVTKDKARGGHTTWAFTVPFMPTWHVITCPANLEYVLKTKTSTFVKGRWFSSRLGQLLRSGIFAADGADWYWQRKRASHIFNVQRFKRYTSDAFADKLKKLGALLDDAASSPPAAPVPALPLPHGLIRASNVVDLHALMYRFTLDTFGHIGFGTDPGCLDSCRPIPFAAAFDRAQQICQQRFFVPCWQLVQLLSGDLVRAALDVREVRAFARGIVRARRQQMGQRHRAAEAPDGDGCGPSDLLSMFMEGGVDPRGRPFSEDQLVDYVINFIIAGRDTTAQALAWTFHLLMQHPAVEAKVVEEARHVLADDAPPKAKGAAAGSDAAAGAPALGAAAAAAASRGLLLEEAGVGEVDAVAHVSFDQLRRLSYTKAVFLEALRLFPSVPQDGKLVLEDDVLPDGTPLPRGSVIMYAPWVINRLPTFWGEDADQFRPERWLELASLPSPFQYPTFNAGPRLCLGQRLAELEGVYALAGLLRQYRFRPAPGAPPVTYVHSSTLPMKSGLWVTVERRRD